jgi:hypothetical protein
MFISHKKPEVVLTVAQFVSHAQLGNVHLFFGFWLVIALCKMASAKASTSLS